MNKKSIPDIHEKPSKGKTTGNLEFLLYESGEYKWSFMATMATFIKKKIWV